MQKNIRLLESALSIQELKKIAEEQFGDMIKMVVDIESGFVAIGGELHSDEEAYLLEQGSRQENLWGINVYPNLYPSNEWIEFDSIINIRPRQNNRSRNVEDTIVREKIIKIVNRFISEK